MSNNYSKLITIRDNARQFLERYNIDNNVIKEKVYKLEPNCYSIDNIIFLDYISKNSVIIFITTMREDELFDFDRVTIKLEG